jgi:hypothetical protein|tara:strand:- start:1666 stop:1803 length:138 start_codon:yes stop_codon:yes gene_type:complete
MSDQRKAIRFLGSGDEAFGLSHGVFLEATLTIINTMVKEKNKDIK